MKGDVSNLQREISQLRKLVEEYRKGSESPKEPVTPRLRSGESSLRSEFDFAQSSITSIPNGRSTSGILETYAAPLPSGRPQSDLEESAQRTSGPSPSEANIAGAISRDGYLQVHGVTSTFHQESVRTGEDGDTLDGAAKSNELESVSHRLIAYAALQKQHENFLFSDPLLYNNLDLDGVSPETAKHLLDIHWNRQHFTYLLTYRPAITESLRTGGPYINKLLLNAIYYTSCQYSDRKSLRADPDDPQTMGAQFYRRFKELLVDEIDKPSIPTAIALLLSGQCLVAYGKQGGGWVLCGTAYRMIIELGCHLTADPRRTEQGSLEIVGTEVRKRLYWGAFVIDKFQSLYLGRAPALRQSEARASKELLDAFEEYEPWSPYVDSKSDSFDVVMSPQAHAPRPAYGVSSFKALLRLAEIATEIMDTFYSMESLKLGQKAALERRVEFLHKLDRWQKELPSHLLCDPEGSHSPPPHQLNPHTTYWTLVILVWRPFMSNGHLSAYADPEFRSVVDKECAAASLKIWALVKTFKNTFTLQRAPYILCYAAYHAVLVLIHSRETRVNFPDCVPYLWSALVDLKHGSHAGLTRPLQMLKSKLTEDVVVPSESYPAENGNGRGAGAFCAGDIDMVGDPSAGAGPGAGIGTGAGIGIANADFLQTLDLDAWNTPFWLDRVVGNQLLQDDFTFGLGSMPF
ncbi:uncharacterized protein A1O5_04359 [Cladophialophora psammophila CBS 110553]|uniref:Xylanolytic transcriptional activator regulatory domain-containing protein n=1 Tax=Cladophialophora psammophila CBS 110553 TaxID=1182543 RepID=W9WVB9_9EURO|nr:uncharacterized protein A1O5_04359 [Cladophialophora psammophila CBS 110553]EXJ71858.1 hypothetical protein A1O5_04359 [Cladophialophora psammophila CBS 110553]